MYAQYRDDVQFFVVYIKEAHAIDSGSPLGGDGNPIVEDPQTKDERDQVAQVCLTRLALSEIPAVVDDMGNTVSEAYGGWPDRLYLIGADGRVAYKGGPGPHGFKPDDLEDAILEALRK